MGLDKNKITVFENKEIVIYNYQKIDLINMKKISTNLYDIIGENLKVSELDGYQIKIRGIIKEIIFKYE